MSTIELGQGDALLVIDMQNDFLPGGSLGVADGDHVIAPINRLLALYDERGLPIYASRDWHPGNHVSFAAQGGTWPPHCVAGTAGASFTAELSLPGHAIVVSKADTADTDAYSAFSRTDLATKMRKLAVTRIAVCGLATDYCVLNTVSDALKAGFETLIVPEAMRAVEVQPGDGARAIEQMLAQGAVAVELAGSGLARVTSASRA